LPAAPAAGNCPARPQGISFSAGPQKKYKKGFLQFCPQKL
jgi:hypothetical protein